MCGIFCLINKKNNFLNKDKLFKSFNYINSRGSDENSQVYLDTNFNLLNIPNENLLTFALMYWYNSFVVIFLSLFVSAKPSIPFIKKYENIPCFVSFKGLET